MMKHILLLFLLSASSVWSATAQTTDERHVIHFRWNKWLISDSSQREELKPLIERLRAEPDASVSVVGRTDKTGTERANRSMSLRRAQSVKAYLVAHGANAENITTQGLGVDRTAKDDASARRAEVVVTFAAAQPTPKPAPQPKAKPQPKAEPQTVEQTPAVAETPVTPLAEPTPAPAQLQKPVFTRWSVGANVGIPFFWGDMATMAANKTYIGFSAGVQGSYRFSQLLSVSLSADYARGKIGARGYAKDYLLTPDGMTHYTPQTGEQAYKDLYSQVGVFSLGLSLDINANRIFYRDVTRHRFSVWVSPTIYGQAFNANVYEKSGDAKFSDGTTRPAGFSLGLGGALSLRYKVCEKIELQFKNSLIWITDNKFDGITTPYGKTKHNVLWTPQLGVIWNIK